MSRKTDGQAKYFRKFEPTSTGTLVKIEDEAVFSINSLRIIIKGICQLKIKGKTYNDTSTTDIAVINSSSSHSRVIDIATWDFVEYEVIGITGNPEIIVSGFFVEYQNNLQIGRDYDLLVASEVSNTVVDYTYSLLGNTIQTIRTTYATSAQKKVVRVETI